MKEIISARLMNDEKIIIEKDGEQEKEYDVAFIFEGDGGKTFVAYTEGEVDATGDIVVKAFYYTDDKNSLHIVEDEDEKALVDEVCEDIRNDIYDQGISSFLERYNEEELSQVQNAIDRVIDNMDIEAWIRMTSSSIDRIKDTDLDLLTGLAGDIISKYYDEEYASCRAELSELLKKIDKRLDSKYSINSLGMKAYSQKDFATAEKAFLESENWNNLAYMIRRKEVLDCANYTYKYVANLLKEGVYKKDPFSMINMSLLWALNIQGEDNWKLADDIMSMIPNDNEILLSSAVQWWLGVANAGDVEGYLVHYWLLKHKQISTSPLGGKSELLHRIRLTIVNLPEFI